MSENEIIHSHNYADTIGCLKLNIEKDYLFDKEKILLEMNNKISNYDKYISNFHCFEPNKLGTDKIISTIKNRFFNV